MRYETQVLQFFRMKIPVFFWCCRRHFDTSTRKQHLACPGSGEGSEGLGGFGAEPGQVQQVWRRFQRRSGRLWCRARSGSTGFRRRFRRRLQKPSQFRFIQLTENQLRCFQRLASQHGCKKIKRCGCWGYH